MWQTILITLAVDVGGLLLIYAILRDRVRRAASAASQVSELREEIDRLVVELNQTADRNIALIEDRIASLNELAAVADKRIGLLRREIEKHDVGVQLYSRLADGRGPRPSVDPAARPQNQAEPPVAGPRPPAEPAPQPQVQAESPAPRAAGTGADPSRAELTPAQAPLPVELSARSLGGPDLRQRVLMLHRAGFSSALIATRVGAPRGEVELIIALEERKVAPEGRTLASGER